MKCKDCRWWKAKIKCEWFFTTSWETKSGDCHIEPEIHERKPESDGCARFEAANKDEGAP